MGFYRSNHGTFAGVCGGLGNYCGLDPVFIRLAFLLTISTPFPSILVYLLITILSYRDPNPKM